MMSGEVNKRQSEKGVEIDEHAIGFHGSPSRVFIVLEALILRIELLSLDK